MFLASTRIARDSVTCHICLCPFRSVIPKSSFFFARIYNHCQIYHRWKWVKQRKHPKPGLPIFTLGSKDTGKEIVTELIGPIPFIRKKKKRYLYGSIQSHFCSVQVSPWQFEFNIKGYNLWWQKAGRCDYDNSNIKVHNSEVTALEHDSSLFLLWNLDDSCLLGLWPHVPSR